MVKWAPFYQLDAFTSELFRGNPAAICLMSTELGEKVDAGLYDNLIQSKGTL